MSWWHNAEFVHALIVAWHYFAAMLESSLASAPAPDLDWWNDYQADIAPGAIHDLLITWGQFLARQADPRTAYLSAWNGFVDGLKLLLRG